MITDLVTNPILLVGFDKDGALISSVNLRELKGEDRGSDFFAYAMSCIARGYVDMMLTHGQFANGDRKPREIDREYMEAELVREFTQHMANGRNGELVK
mgnify:CR=1 FL=1